MGVRTTGVKSRHEVPGPGKYNPNEEAAGARGPAVGIGTSERNTFGGGSKSS